MNQTLKVNEAIDIIVSKTDYSQEEVKDMIKETIESMDNMVNEEGAVYVVADNLGISLDTDLTTTAFKVNQLLPGQTNISLIGRVQKIFPIREFNRKDGNMGKVQNIVILDETGTVRMALWDAKTDLISQKNILTGSIIKVIGASSKAGQDNSIELSLGLHGMIDVDQTGEHEDEFPKILVAELVEIKDISLTLKEVSILVKIIDMKGIIEFEKEGKKGKVRNVVLADQTGKIQLTLWHDAIDSFEKNVGDVVKLTDLRVTENKFGDVQLTYNPYSTSKIEQNETLESLKISSGGILTSLSEITDGMNNITVTGKVIEIGELKEFERNGEKRQVQNITIMDSSSSRRVTFWGEDTQKINDFSLNNIISMTNCRSKMNDYSNEVEITFSSASVLEINPEVDLTKFEHSKEVISLSNINEVKRGVSVKGLITRIFEKRDVTLNDGRTASVMNILIQGEDGVTAKVAAWDELMPKLENLVEGSGILLINVRVKPGSGEFGPDISINTNSEIEEVEMDPIIQTAESLKNQYEKTSLDLLVDGSRVRIQGTIVNAFPPTIYDGCSQCAKKIDVEEGESFGICREHGKSEISPKLILTIILDDSKSTISIKFFSKIAERLIEMTAAEAKEKIERLTDPRAITGDLNMRDIWVEGKVGLDENREEKYITANNFGNVNYEKNTDEILNRYDDTW